MMFKHVGSLSRRWSTSTIRTYDDDRGAIENGERDEGEAA
jgi:hypothetical protein